MLLGRTNEEIQVLKKTYFDKYNEDLSVLMNSELGGDYKKVIMSALQVRVASSECAICYLLGA